MSQLIQDARYGFRRLIKQPGFTAVAVLTLALGIGANTAIFSAVRAVLMQTLPVRDPERLVFFSDSTSEGTMTGDPVTGAWQLFSYPVYQHFRTEIPAFQDIAAFRSGESELSVQGESGGQGGQAQIASGHLVTGNYFSVLGTTPALGRSLTPDDDVPGSPGVAVVSDRYWRTHLGSEAGVVGRVVEINGIPVTIVGVMEPGFFGERVRRAPDYWLPLQLQPQIEGTDSRLADPSSYWLNLAGRLKPQASLAQAQASAVTALRQFLTDQAGSDLSAERRDEIERTGVLLAGGGKGISDVRVQYTESLYLLAAAVALVMLIACANIANLLLARGAARHEEMAVRLALGASAGRLTRQLLTEGVLLAIAGGAVGLLFADWGVHLLARLVANDAPLEVGINPVALGFTAAISLLAGILFSLAPAWRSGRVDLGSALKERSQNAGGGRRGPGAGAFLVAGQVAFSLVLLVGAGLLTRSLTRLENQDLGFNREGVLVVATQPRLAGYRVTELGPLYRNLLERVRSVPGVVSATLGSFSPLSGMSMTNDVTVEGHSPEPGENPLASINQVGPEYSETLGIPVILGRGITDRDGAGSPAVAVVNQAFVKQYFPAGNPIGRGFIIGDDPAESPRYEIVGVMGDARYRGVAAEPGVQVYLAILQSENSSAYRSELQIRTRGNPEAFARQIRAAIAEVDPKLPIVQVSSLELQLKNSLRRPRLLAQLVSVFGIVALLLACVGLYGIIAQSVTRRTNELGIRMALGADRRDIIGMVLKETGLLILSGLAIGIPAALAAARLIQHQLFQVGPQDPTTLVVTSLLLVAVAAAAGYIPAWRASRVDPMVALRKG